MLAIHGSILAAAAMIAATEPALSQTAAAQGYPVKPIRLVVPFTPGGTTDIIARLIGQKLEEAWKLQVIVDNRPGAGGTIGVELVAKAPPDGYTLIFGHIGTFGFGPSLYARLPYDAVRDFAPVVAYAMVPNMLVVHPSLPAKTVKELVALARARPGQLNYGSAGNGSVSHMAVEYFKLLSKIDLTQIPYKGTSPLVTDLIAGQTSLTITGVPGLQAHVKSGRLRALAVSTAQRLRHLPELPTVIEAGVPGYEVTSWFGPLAPAKTPREIVVRLNSELVKTLQRPDVRERLAADGTEPMGGTPEQYAALIKSEIERWAVVIKQAGVRLE